MATPPQIPYAKGDKVKVFDVNGRHMGMPSGGWDGVIETVGTKYIHIAYAGARGGIQAFDPVRRKAKDNDHRFFETLEQAQLSERLSTAVQTLRDAGFHLRDDGAAEDLELVEAAAAAVTAVLTARQTHTED